VIIKKQLVIHLIINQSFSSSKMNLKAQTDDREKHRKSDIGKQ